MKYTTFLSLILFTVASLMLSNALVTTSAEAITTTPTAAQTTGTPTPTSQPVDMAIINQINNLKEKVASKVAQLHLEEKRGIIGTITSLDPSNQLIVINDVQNNTRYIDVDQITKFTDNSGSTIGFSDLQKGNLISALGDYNKDSRHLLARFVDATTLPVYVTGEIISLDRINGTFYIQDDSNKKHNIDVESFTKTNTFTQSTDLSKIGFSKLNVGDRVVIVGYKSKTDASLTVASRIIQFADAKIDPAITASIAPVASPSATTIPAK